MSDGLIRVVVSGNNTDEILGRIERSERASSGETYETAVYQEKDELE